MESHFSNIHLLIKNLCSVLFFHLLMSIEFKKKKKKKKGKNEADMGETTNLTNVLK